MSSATKRVLAVPAVREAESGLYVCLAFENKGAQEKVSSACYKISDWLFTNCIRATHTPGPEDSSPATYWTDDICDRALFEIIMQDYLSHVYPLVPVVHRPSFKRSLQDPHQRDECFSAVTVSIAALVVATMPSRFHAYKAHDPPLRFVSRKEMVHFCYMKVVNLRVSTYYDQLNFQKFAISYLFFAAFLQLGDHNWSRMLSVEAFQLARLLNLHRISEYRGLNCIETQLRKKGFWLVFYCHV